MNTTDTTTDYQVHVLVRFPTQGRARKAMHSSQARYPDTKYVLIYDDDPATGGTAYPWTVAYKAGE